MMCPWKVAHVPLQAMGVFMKAQIVQVCTSHKGSYRSKRKLNERAGWSIEIFFRNLKVKGLQAKMPSQ